MIIKWSLRACGRSEKTNFPPPDRNQVKQSLRQGDPKAARHFPAQEAVPSIIIAIGWPSLLNNVRETHTLEMIPKSMILSSTHWSWFINEIVKAAIVANELNERELFMQFSIRENIVASSYTTFLLRYNIITYHNLNDLL